jgi:hypothetical protein
MTTASRSSNNMTKPLAVAAGRSRLAVNAMTFD